MHTEPHHGEVRHTKPKHLAERFEGLLGTAMIIVVVLLAIGLIYGIMSGSGGTPSYLQ
jgi:cell division protein FtsL